MESKRVSLRLSEEENTYVASTSFGQLLVGEKGHRPMELLLVSLAGCSGVDVSIILKKKRQEVKDIRIDVLGLRRDEHPRYYEKIEIHYTIVGKNINPKAVEDAIKLSLEKYCSVHAMLKEKAHISYSYSIENVE
ncbi:OsmC family protein [Thermocrinis minervae]|uniref:Putative redox protein n=1 Tax=Thermocrinis minervae TaxID=381751 RepID=A0A1M6QHB6_9AQUI|nr:OsmC family protein [Thermocrinis minervae]SHK19596.1 putative redox protein [Thermocrinis minervae]